MEIVTRTRNDARFLTGVSTRGAVALYKASQAFAAINGRDYVLPEDVKIVAKDVLCHRIVSAGGRRANETAAYFDDILRSIPVPLERI